MQSFCSVMLATIVVGASGCVESIDLGNSDSSEQDSGEGSANNSEGIETSRESDSVGTSGESAGSGSTGTSTSSMPDTAEETGSTTGEETQSGESSSGEPAPQGPADGTVYAFNNYPGSDPAALLGAYSTGVLTEQCDVQTVGGCVFSRVRRDTIPAAPETIGSEITVSGFSGPEGSLSLEFVEGEGYETADAIAPLWSGNEELSLLIDGDTPVGTLAAPTPLVVTAPLVGGGGGIELSRSGAELTWEPPEGGAEGLLNVNLAAAELEPFFSLECRFDAGAGSATLPSEFLEQIVPTDPDTGFLFVTLNVWHTNEGLFTNNDDQVIRFELSTWADTPDGQEYSLDVEFVP